MGQERISFTAKSVNIESSSSYEVTVEVTVRDIDEILQHVSEEDLFNHIANSDLLTAKNILNYITLEDVFEQIPITELKRRLAQYMIDYGEE